MRRVAASGLGLLVVASALLLGTGSAAATTTPAPTESAPAVEPAPGDAPVEGELINARVRTDDGEDVAGVDVRVEQGGEEVVSGTTDDAGIAELEVPEAGDYDVTIDVETIPEELSGLVPRLETITTSVRAGSPRTVAFRLGEASEQVSSGGIAWDRLPQLFMSGLRFGLIVALAAIGLSLIFGTTGLTNFAHGELVTFGGLMGYFFNVVAGIPLIPATLLAVVAGGVFGWANDRGLWGPLRARGSGLIAMMIVSIGLAIFLRYFYLYIFGGSSRFYADYQGQTGVGLWGITLRPADWISMAIAVVVLTAVGVALLRTRIGKATRAVADNPALAAASGIDVDRVIRTVWIGGAALAALAGVLLGLAQAVNFQMGFQILLLVFAAVTLGGLGTAFGALVGSLVVGVFIEVSTLVVPTELKNVGALAVLIVILLIRPQGILGRAERIG